MHTVEIIEGDLVVMDEDGQVEDVERLTGYRAAKQRIGAWARIYTIEVAKAYNLLEAYFRQRSGK